MNEQRPQVIIVKQQSNGCLVTTLVYLLFGWIGLAVMAAWKLTKLGWNLFVAYPVKWTVALTKLTWRGSIALTRWSIPYIVALSHRIVQAFQAMHARYGWRFWAILGAFLGVVLIVSLIVGYIAGATGH